MQTSWDRWADHCRPWSVLLLVAAGGRLKALLGFLRGSGAVTVSKVTHRCPDKYVTVDVFYWSWWSMTFSCRQILSHLEEVCCWHPNQDVSGMKMKTLFGLENDCHGQELVIVPACLALLSAALWQDSEDLSAFPVTFVQCALSEASFHKGGCECVQNQKNHEFFG